MGGVGEAQYVVANKVAGGRGAEGPVVVGGGNDGELFNDVPSEMRRLHLLAGNIVESEAVEVGEQAGCRLAVEAAPGRGKERQRMPAPNLRNDSGNHGSDVG